uniref:ULP_PROTEASE domain-containing protein n=1 Tax=Panagrellus redivivus TaxID=6233 RepID=A0A7E4V9T2_PANRE
MMPRLLIICQLLVGFILALAHATPFNVVHPNRTLIVLSAPSVWDDNYREDFLEIIAFQIELAKTIHEHENVVIIADKHTMPYLDGRSARVKKRLPYDALIEANVYDVNINDFAPIGFKQLTKFIYRTDNLADMASSQIDKSMTRFLNDHRVKVDKREQDMVLSGEDVIHNGVNKALVSDNVILRNAGRLPDWAMMIKLLNAFKKVLVVENPLNGTRLRFDDVMGFIDEQILAVSPIEADVRERLETAVKKKFRSDLSLIDLPLGGAPNDAGNCGIYTSVISTNKYVYVPVFGSDPSNWKFGYSTMTDRMVVHLLEANSRRKIIPVNIPRALCRRGLSLRSIAWSVRGYAADNIVNHARQTALRH